MKLYLLYQSENQEYDTYDELVVCSENEDKARLIHPNSGGWDKDDWLSCWASSPENVKVTELGEALPEYKEGDIICKSFNAG